MSENTIKQIIALEEEMRGKRAELNKLRRELCGETVEDYSFQNHSGGETKLAELFQGKEDLILIHNMGVACPYCTLWADGFNGVTKHLEDRAGLVLVSADDVEAQKKFKESRSWTFEMVSAKESSFIEDMGFCGEEGSPYGKYMPGVSTFRKEADGSIKRIAKTYFGPGDDFCATWHLLDLLAEGANAWGPQFSYS